MLVPKSDFIGLEGLVHLGAGGETPVLRRHMDAIERFARDKVGGQPTRDHFWEVRERVCTRLAGMMNLQPDDIALIGNASEGIARVISSFPWMPGDNAVTANVEYPSGLYGLARLQKLEVKLRAVQAKNWYLDVDDIIAACDKRTRLVIVSYVSFLTGQRLDLHRLAAGLRRYNAALLVDATHGLGVVPVPGEVCDFVVSSGYKWLLGTHTGILAWNRRSWSQFEPLGVGWRSIDHHLNPEYPHSYHLHDTAARAELGNPNWLDVFILDSAIDYLLQVGIDRISAHALALGGDLRAGLLELGLPVTTPARCEERAGNICFMHPAAEKLARTAAEQGIIVWGSEGRVRSSVHLYVTPDDIATYLSALPDLLKTV